MQLVNKLQFIYDKKQYVSYNKKSTFYYRSLHS